jgi:hypothetical protein
VDVLCQFLSESLGEALTAEQKLIRFLGASALEALEDRRPSDAAAHCQRMFSIDSSNSWAYSVLSHIRYPGPSYLEVLSQLHHLRRPAAYVEIGVFSGFSMGCARPPTKCIGIDPEPIGPLQFAADTEMFPMTSDEFFRKHNLSELIGDRPVEFAFIDGLHLFESALEDFINLERYCSTEAIVALHDCLPIDKVTATRERTTDFWTGDVWRVLPVLSHFRPDLTITAIECAPSGLVIVDNLDPDSVALSKRKAEALRFGFNLQFEQKPSLEQMGVEVISNNSLDSLARNFKKRATAAEA